MKPQLKPNDAPSVLTKGDPSRPALVATAPAAIAIRAGTHFDGHHYVNETPVLLPDAGLIAGADYMVIVDRMGVAMAVAIEAAPAGNYLGGFHFAPGGNAAARQGGDEVPAINPFSLWDLNFRPACADPRGMTLVEAGFGKFWCDIYLTGVDHLAMGTSRLGVTIADGDDPPADVTGHFSRLDYATAVKVMAMHGKTLLSFEEFAAAAFGVTEKSARSRDPKTTKLDAARTSKWGLMQATGNLWIWGHDGDPDEPRPSIFGGSWFVDRLAGSRCASLGDWPGGSSESLGARGRSDHLQLG